MNLVDIAGAHGQKDIAGPECILQNHHKLVKRGGKFRGDSLLTQTPNQFFGHVLRLGVHLFPSGKHRGDPNPIGVSKTLREFVHERGCAGNLMRLECHADAPPTEFLPYSVEGGRNRGRMMGVIVHQRHTAPGAEFFKSPVDAGKLRNAIPNGSGGDTDFETQRRGSEGIQHVVLAH